MTRWTLLLAAFLVAQPVAAQDKDAEALYRDFEKKLTGAKALRAAFTIEATGGENVQIKGTLSYAAGNKLRLQMEGKDRGKTISGTFVSDGKRLSRRSEYDGKPETKEEATPDALSEHLLGFFARGSLFLGVEKSMRPMAEFHPSRLKPAMFKSVGKEKLGEREAQVIEFHLTVPGDSFAPVVKMWFDTKTRLPLKAVLELQTGDTVDLRITETYSQWDFDPAPKEGEFVLPR